jgi:hypothetical protein
LEKRCTWLTSENGRSGDELANNFAIAPEEAFSEGENELEPGHNVELAQKNVKEQTKNIVEEHWRNKNGKFSGTHTGCKSFDADLTTMADSPRSNTGTNQKITKPSENQRTHRQMNAFS